ncbi:MAG: NAD(P)H-hydrate dehydratase [Candidatus Omnitrophica bacterium]|nr:NAD(P)H-hydrate dehydratase [Candidatus Omnitrophota bacterium]
MNIRQEFQKQFKKRKPGSHKGDYGRIFVLAGSEGLSGACYLTSMAALRSGAGLVTIGVPKTLLLPLAKRLTEAMMTPLPQTKAGTLSRAAFQPIQRFLKTQDVLAIGPGMSLNRDTQQVIRKTVLASTKPMVIDADGLNAFQGRVALFRKLKAPAVLTPHAGEFVRLFGGSKPKTDSERKRRAREASKRHRVIIVLKGHHTVVASPAGEIYVNQTGNPGMATGGSGDALTGVIAAMLGQNVKPFQAACFGVLIHGLAGDLVAQRTGEASLIASDILGALPLAFRKVLGHNKARR